MFQEGIYDALHVLKKIKITLRVQALGSYPIRYTEREREKDLTSQNHIHKWYNKSAIKSLQIDVVLKWSLTSRADLNQRYSVYNSTNSNYN